MKMEADFETILDVALEGPEIGPVNLSILHGLLREVFKRFDLSKKKLFIGQDNPDFSNAYNFIKTKVDNRPRTAGGSAKRERTRVSVIVSDYARSQVGHQSPPAFDKPSLLPADLDDRLRLIESQLKIVKNFPSVDELRTWAQNKASSDTVVTDLWHFVSLNHRMDGAEEGIQKLTELVDKLIPELKRFGNERSKLEGQIEDLYGQLKDVSDRVSRIDERIGRGVEKAADFQKELENIDNKLTDYAKLVDLEDFVLKESFVETQGKAAALANQFEEELSKKASIAMLDDLVDHGDLQRLKDWVETLRAQMETVPSKDDLLHLDLYVKWPQLENALLNYPSRPGSRGSGRRINESYGSFATSPGSSGDAQNDSRPSSRSDSRPSSSVPGRRRSTKSRKPYPSDSCWNKLNDLGRISDRQGSIMDAIERLREELDNKVGKEDVEHLLTQGDLNDLLNLLKDLKIDVKGLENWRELVDDEKVPALRELLKKLENQVSDLLNNVGDLKDEDKRKRKALETLFTYVDRLEDNKLERDDPDFLELKKNKNYQKPQQGPQGKEDISDMIDDFVKRDKFDKTIRELKDWIKKVEDKIENLEISNNKSFNDILQELDDKLDRAELEPLREYLENRYNILSQQVQPVPQKPLEESCKHQPSKSADKKPLPYDPSLTHQHFIPIPTANDETLVKKPNGFRAASKSAPIQKSTDKALMPGIIYDSSDTSGCGHPLYGDGGFVPSKKSAALFRTQMKFNCLSCDRPLTMQSDSYFQTIRGRQLNAYELDQLRLLQKILKGDNPNKPTRACGGHHTSSIPPSKRLTAKLNAEKSARSVPEYVYESDLIDGEVNIEGLDGKFYRGLISRKDLRPSKNRSTSANSNLRTVSPAPYSGSERPFSKSLDFNSSYGSGLGNNTSGLGTSPESIDIVS